KQVGTHAYLLQQFCFHAFHFKRKYAYNHNAWTEIENGDKRQLIEVIKGRISTFLSRLWTRLVDSLKMSSSETRSKFYSLIESLDGKSAKDEFDSKFWNSLGSELHYILANEGIIR